MTAWNTGATRASDPEPLQTEALKEGPTPESPRATANRQRPLNRDQPPSHPEPLQTEALKKGPTPESPRATANRGP